MADTIALNSDGVPMVLFVGYSYGVGNYFKVFAEALNERGIDVQHAVFADGIRRFKAAKFLSLRFFHGLFDIAVPANVKQVTAFVQAEDRLLRGHAVRAVDADRTTVKMCTLEGYDHASIDESPRFHRAALTSAQLIIQEAGL